MGKRQGLRQRRKGQDRRSGDRPRRPPAKYFGYTKCRDGVYRWKGDGHFISSGLQKPDSATDRRSAGAIKQLAMTSKCFLGIIIGAVRNVISSPFFGGRGRMSGWPSPKFRTRGASHSLRMFNK